MARLMKKLAPSTWVTQIDDPTHWPCWPWLPMKRSKSEGFPWQLAVFHADDAGTGPYRLWSYNLMEGCPRWFPIPGDEPLVQYATRDEMIADGWEVD